MAIPVPECPSLDASSGSAAALECQVADTLTRNQPSWWRPWRRPDARPSRASVAAIRWHTRTDNLACACCKVFGVFAIMLSVRFAQAAQVVSVATQDSPHNDKDNTKPMTPMTIQVEPHHAHEHESFYAGLRHAVLVLVIVSLAIPIAHFALRPRFPRYPARSKPPHSDSRTDGLRGLNDRSSSEFPSNNRKAARSSNETVEPLPAWELPAFASSSMTLRPSPMGSAESFTLDSTLSNDMSPLSTTSAACAPPAAASSALAALRWLSNLIHRRRTRYAPIPTVKPAAQPPPLFLQPQPPPSTFLQHFHLAIPHLSTSAPLDDPILGFPFRVSLPYTLLVISLAIAVAAPILVCISMTFRFRKGGDLHADLQWAVHSLTWLATWCLLPLAYFDAESLSGQVWTAHAAGAGLRSFESQSGPSSSSASHAHLNEGRVEPESSLRQGSGARQRHVTAPASTSASSSPSPAAPSKHNRPPDLLSVNPSTPRQSPTRQTSLTRSRLSETLATLVPIYALTLVFFTMVPYSSLTSVTHVLVIGYALTSVAPLGLRLTLRPLVAELMDPDAAFHAALDAAKAECARLEAAIGLVEVRIMAAESEVGIGMVRREHEEEEKREQPVSEPDSGVGVGDDGAPSFFEEKAREPTMISIQEEEEQTVASSRVPAGQAGIKPRLPKLVISTDPANSSLVIDSANNNEAGELAAIQVLSPPNGSSSLSHPHPLVDTPVSTISRPRSTDVVHDHILRPSTPLSTHGCSLPLSAPSSRRRTVSSPDSLPTSATYPPTSHPESRAVRRVRDMHRARTKLRAAQANARASLSRVPQRFTYRRGWIARARAGVAVAVLAGGLACAAACSLGVGPCSTLRLFVASSVLVALVVRGLLVAVTGHRERVSRGAVFARVLRMVVVSGALGEAVEAVVLGPWAPCGGLGRWGGWIGKVIVPVVVVVGFWLRVGLAVRESVRARS